MHAKWPSAGWRWVHVRTHVFGPSSALSAANGASAARRRSKRSEVRGQKQEVGSKEMASRMYVHVHTCAARPLNLEAPALDASCALHPALALEEGHHRRLRLLEQRRAHGVGERAADLSMEGRGRSRGKKKEGRKGRGDEARREESRSAKQGGEV